MSDEYQGVPADDGSDPADAASTSTESSDTGSSSTGSSGTGSSGAASSTAAFGALLASDGAAAPAAGEENLSRILSTLGTRIDALVTSTTSYRSAITDRLTEYADLVTRLTRTQATDLEEYRQSNERTVSELRRSLVVSEETLDRVAGQIDRALGDGGGDDQTRRLLAEVHSILDAQESLGRFITEALDEFADRVDARITADHEATLTQVAALEAVVAGLPAQVGGAVEATVAPIRTEVAGLSTQVSGVLDGALVPMRAEMAGLRESIADVASGEVLGALWDEVRELRSQLAEGLVVETDGPIDSQLAGVQAELAALTGQIGAGRELDSASTAQLQTEFAALSTAVRDLLERADVVDEEPPADATSAVVLSAVSELRAEIASMRTDLVDGVHIEPSEDFVSALGAVQRDLASLPEALAAGGGAGAGGDDGVVLARIEGLAAAVEAVGASVEGLKAQLDEGLVIAEEEPRPSAVDPGIADQLAAIGDAMRSEFDGLRSLTRSARSADASVDLSPLGAQLDDLRADIASLADRPVEVAPTGLGPDAIDLVREDIRASADTVLAELRAATERLAAIAPAERAPAPSGGADDALVESLTKELAALRRRIRLRAEGEYLSDDQLDVLAEAIASRLAR